MFQESNSSNLVELKVLLPDRNIATISIKRNSTTDQVYQVRVGHTHNHGFHSYGFTLHGGERGKTLFNV